ncbi:hypothetical protein Mp_5g11090 [Marchantia polymorpha subsp. ruderalis]|uniref:Uncharacterized protein n=2 Tax=Marchantia polymorpha TaxID=3197 RepID=A0AAF6BH60_MARPO|nr:hypothetical protein MARPO_0093s0031 [Marchantia polymorpha]BBN11344.1 hypothetical protein Mp_5g11090 [Marchantia polymorpha subsp. ruderalis]|eukprot:PTQ32952.1 hypothetical protein MARPO_0093s0031 [Marchantia polymorpha]
MLDPPSKQIDELREDGNLPLKLLAPISSVGTTIVIGEKVAADAAAPGRTRKRDGPVRAPATSTRERGEGWRTQTGEVKTTTTSSSQAARQGRLSQTLAGIKGSGHRQHQRRGRHRERERDRERERERESSKGWRRSRRRLPGAEREREEEATAAAAENEKESERARAEGEGRPGKRRSCLQ